MSRRKKYVKKPGKADVRLLGCNVSPAIDDYIILFTTAHRSTRSSILISIIDRWMGDIVKQYPESRLMDTILNDYIQRRIISKANRGTSFRLDSFLKTVDRELRFVRFPPEYINVILEGVTKEYKEYIERKKLKK